jgi:hypothetical protein
VIHFACKQCGKPFTRADEAAGTLVFCECGTGNRVPWESTMAAPPAEPEALGPAADSSMPGDEEREIPHRRTRSPVRREVPDRDPSFCLNHQDRPRQETCADCGESFCASCVITFDGQTLCGPCKNFRIRSMQRPAQFSVYALFSLLLGLVTGPTGLFCVGMSTATRSSVPSFAGLVLPILAVFLGAKALRDIETQPNRTGRSIAISGMVCGIVTAFLTVVWAMLVERQLD